MKTSFDRKYSEPIHAEDVPDKLLEIAEVAVGLLSVKGWSDKPIGRIEVVLYEPGEEQREQQSSDAELSRLSKLTMPFGKHEGQQVDQVPIEYLEWLCDAQGPFLAKLRAYLNHPAIKQEIGGQ